MMSGAPAHGGDVAPATSRPTHADAWPGQRTGTRDTALTDSPFGGDGGRDPLQPVDGVQLYTRRWYVLAVFTAMAFMQSMNWATWSPIATVAKQYYHWSDDTIALLANWGPLMFIPFSFPAGYLMDTWGMRPAILLNAGLVTVGAALRCAPNLWSFAHEHTDYFIHAGHVLNAIAGPVCMAGTVKVSEVWFGAKERTTATGIGSQAALIGLAANFLLGPYVVQAHDPTASGQQIEHLLQLQFWMTLPSLVGAVLYLPAHPPTPPSKSAAASSDSAWDTMKQLACHKSFILLAVCYGASTGVFMGWSILLEDSLHAVGYGQTEAGWMGFIGTLAGGIGGAGLGYFADRFHRFKLLLVTLYFASAGFWAYFALACEKDVPHNIVLLYVVSAFGSLAVNASIPLFYELAVEVTHPAGEATVAAMLANTNNFFCMTFLLVPLNKLGVTWINWAMCGTCLLFGVVMTSFKETYRRYAIDVPGTGTGTSEHSPLLGTKY